MNGLTIFLRVSSIFCIQILPSTLLSKFKIFCASMWPKVY